MTTRVLQQVFSAGKSAVQRPLQSSLRNIGSATATARIGNTAARSFHSTPTTQQKLCYGKIINATLDVHAKLHGLPRVLGLGHLHRTIQSNQQVMITGMPHVNDPSDTIEIAIASNFSTETHHQPLPLNMIQKMRTGVDEACELFDQPFSTYATSRLDHNRFRKAANSKDATATVTAQKQKALHEQLEAEFTYIHDHLPELHMLIDEWISAAAEDRLPAYIDTTKMNAAQKKHLTVVAREEMQKHPILAPLLNAAKAIYIPRATEGALNEAEQKLQRSLENAVPIIYSEGARGFNHTVHRPRPGAAILAERNDIHLLPVVLKGIPPNWLRSAITQPIRRLLNRHSPVTVIFLPPYPKIGTTENRLPGLLTNEIKQHTAAQIIGGKASADFLHGDRRPKPATGLPPKPTE